MAAKRQRKKQASRRGLSLPELEMLEMLEEMLERFRWTQALVHAQSYLLREKLGVDDPEIDVVLEGATRAIEKDATWQRWEHGLARLRRELTQSERAIEDAIEEDIAQLPELEADDS